MSGHDFETMAGALEASGDYRVLRRLAFKADPLGYDSSMAKLAIVIDVETTGLDPKTDEVIQLAMQPVLYSTEGRVLEMLPAFDRFRQPSKPIPAFITDLTGIDDAMVAGHSIDAAEVESVLAFAAIVIAHIAGFDGRFVERLWPMFRAKPWACFQSQIPWSAEGFEGQKLAYLATQSSFFYDRHRAPDDCHATVAILDRTLPKSGRTALQVLLEEARRSTIRIWAIGAPFARKDDLKKSRLPLERRRRRSAAVLMNYYKDAARRRRADRARNDMRLGANGETNLIIRACLALDDQSTRDQGRDLKAGWHGADSPEPAPAHRQRSSDVSQTRYCSRFYTSRNARRLLLRSSSRTRRLPRDRRDPGPAVAESGRTAIQVLLKEARRITTRIRAIGAPYAQKDDLKT